LSSPQRDGATFAAFTDKAAASPSAAAFLRYLFGAPKRQTYLSAIFSLVLLAENSESLFKLFF
jgi:hypothetical protein